MQTQKIIVGILLLQSLFIAPSAYPQCYGGNCRNGYGSYINQYGDIFTGNFKDGLCNGYAKMTGTNGDEYSGFWVLGYRQGWGILCSGIDTIYEGDWHKNMMQGDGIYHYPSGKKYKGQFRNNKPNGRGVYYDLNGKIIADGFFEDGEYIPGEEPKNAGTSYLETFKVNRLVKEYNISEYPFISGFTQSPEKIRNEQVANYESLWDEKLSEGISRKHSRERNKNNRGTKSCFTLSATYMANYGEFSTLEDVVKKFAEVYLQITDADKSFTVVNDIRSLESSCIKRYIFFKDNGKYYSQDWLHLSIYQWKNNHKYFLELGCGFGAGKVMKVSPHIEKQNKLFADNLILLLNDADNSFRSYADNDSILTCTADLDTLACFNLNIELPGIGKLRYVPLRSSDIYKGVSGYAEAATKKEASKIYHHLVSEVKNSLDASYVYTESVAADNINSEIVFASFSEIHNDHTPVVRINMTKATDINYNITLSVQYDAFDIVQRKSPIIF